MKVVHYILHLTYLENQRSLNFWIRKLCFLKIYSTADGGHILLPDGNVISIFLQHLAHFRN